jgi:putative ABC transport system permease protein
MRFVRQDVRYALRMLAKTPGFTLIALFTLSIGIAANASIFTVVDSVLLRKLPYPHSERLVRVYDLQPPHENTPSDFPEFQERRALHEIFQTVGGYFPSNFDLTGQGEPTRLSGLRVSSDLLPVLGIQPMLGRGFRPEEEARAGDRVCLISYGLWKSKFGQDPAILGKTLKLSDNLYTVVGVLPQATILPRDPDVIGPLRLDAATAPRGLHFLSLIGRLRDGISLEQARKEIETRAAEHREQKVSGNDSMAAQMSDHSIALVSLKEDTVGNSSTALLVMFGAVGCVLLIVCANLANLLLTRAQGRKREVAIRVALGAAPGRIVQQLFTESALLAIAGGFLGLFISTALTQYFVSASLGMLPRVGEIHLDGTIYGFIALLVLLTAVIFGLSPALVALKSSSMDTLKDGGKGSGARSHLQRNILVVAEVGISLVLLIGAGLLLRSFDELSKVNKGFDSIRVLTFDVELPTARYAKPEQQFAFYQQLMQRLKTLPGVEAAGSINSLLLTSNNVNGDVGIEGKVFSNGGDPIADKRIAGGEYFRALHIPLMRGRFFNERDLPGAPAVAIVNQTFANKIFPGEDPVGKHVDFRWDTAAGYQEIVGVVGDVKHDGLELPTDPEIYVPYTQRPDSAFTITLRTQTDPLTMLGAAREQVAQLDANLVIGHPQTLEQVLAASVADKRLRLLLLGTFALLALFLAAGGLYGVMAFAVTARTREIGIRVALGAGPRDVLWMVVREGLRLAAVGAFIGLLVAFALTRFLSSLLFNVKPTDLFTYVVLTTGILVVALAASYIPARRATQMDPVVALRYE